MTPEERALLRQDELEMLDREEKATPGPWQRGIVKSSMSRIYESARPDPHSPIAGVSTPYRAGWEEAEANAEFIAASRTDVPNLLSRLAATRAGERWIPVTERLPPENTPVEVRDMDLLDRAIAQFSGGEWLIETCSQFVNIYPPKSWRPLAELFPVAESETK